MKQTKIDWCDCTINPVVGCKHGCEYCYARKMNDRFGWIKDWCKPQFFPERLEQLKSKKSKSIFMDSMSDLAFYEDEWAKKTFSAMADNPQHKYIYLTKNYAKSFSVYINNTSTPIVNCFIGESFCGGKYKHKLSPDGKSIFTPQFLSIEPLLAESDITEFTTRNNWACNNYGADKMVIIGAETGNRKGKIIPKKKWVDSIVQQCDKNNVRVFMKSSLKEIMGEDFRQDKLLWEIEK